MIVKLEILKVIYRNILKIYTHLMMEEEFFMTSHVVLSVRESVDSTEFLYYIFLLRFILKHLD